MTVTRRQSRAHLRAELRAHRRFKAMIASGSCAYGRPETELYLQAERLAVRLGARPLTEPELDALHESTMADLADLEAGYEAPVAVYSSKLDEYQTRGA